MKIINNLMIDTEDLKDYYNWDEAQMKIEFLNNRNYKGFKDWRFFYYLLLLEQFRRQCKFRLVTGLL